MADHRDLNHTADGLRDTKHSIGSDVNEQSVQATMQEETAVAMHRVAEALEEQNEILQRIGQRIEEIPSERDP